MPRFFAIKKEGDYAYLAPEDAHHVEKSLRMEAGESLEIVVDQKAYRATWEGEGCAKLYEALAPREYPWQVTLFQGLPKGDKLEWIIQKTVELGVQTVVPVEMRYSVAKWKDPKGKKLTRLNRVAYEAAGQCGRDIIPQVEEPQTFSRAVERMGDFDVVLWANEGEKATDLYAVVEALPPKALNIALWVGPEGGFAPDEGECLESVSRSFTLGPMILRTETAGMATLASLFYVCRKKEGAHGS